MSHFERQARRIAPANVEIFTGTREVRALLDCCAECAAEIEGSKWLIRSLPDHDDRPRLAIPALRVLVRMLYVQRVQQYIAALKTAIVRRGGVGFDVSSKEPDLELLDAFHQTLPKNPKPAVVVTACSAAVSVAALIISTLNGNPDRSMLGDLAHATLTADRNGLLGAIPHWAKLHHLQWQLAALTAIADLATTAGSLMVLIVLPAYVLHRRTFAEIAEFEARARTVTGSHPVIGVDLDLIAVALFIPEIAFAIPQLALLAWRFADYHGPAWAPEKRIIVLLCAVTAGLTALIAVACLELRYQYRMRRNRAQPRRTLLQRGCHLVGYLSVLLTCLLSMWSVTAAKTPKFYQDTNNLGLATAANPPPGTYVWGSVDNGAVWFAVTAIEQNVPCTDPHPPASTTDDPQYLKFTVEIWSHEDEFVDPSEAHAIALNHWSVLDSAGHTVADDMYLHPGCSRGGDALIKPLTPGEHTVTDAVVTVPAHDVATLQLVVPSHPSTWRWKIPAAAKPSAQQQP